MNLCVHFVLTVLLILLVASITVISWRLPTELHAKNDGNTRMYYPQANREYQIRSRINYGANQQGGVLFKSDGRNNVQYKRFGHMMDAAFNEHFDRISNKKHLVRKKRDSVFENETSLFAALGGLLFLALLALLGLFCWWSRSCGVEKGDNGEVPPDYVTGARVFIANYNAGYENLAFQEGYASSYNTDSQDNKESPQAEVMETNIDQYINTQR